MCCYPPFFFWVPLYFPASAPGGFAIKTRQAGPHGSACPN
ncbi:hypothetical protein PORCAN_1163 [Porphyromonas crevioricanis JCM 13913]|nr:hypothetical protein PORCAN_1163 [Porphyromonas crevioricanis JCM 13913]